MRVTRLPLKPMHIALIIASLLYLIAASASGAPGTWRDGFARSCVQAALLASPEGPQAPAASPNAP